jgi:hypothetical protein
MLSQPIIRVSNDSLKIWDDLNQLWGYEDFEATICIYGLTSEFHFPPLIPDSRDSSIKYFDDSARKIILKNGIYKAGILISGNNDLFIFCNEDSIEIMWDFDTIHILKSLVKYFNNNHLSNESFIPILKEAVLRIDYEKYDSIEYLDPEKNYYEKYDSLEINYPNEN